MNEYLSAAELAQLNILSLPKLLASLSDAFTKTVAANAKVMPETSKLATAIEVLELFGEVVKERYPQHLQAYVELVEPLGVEIEKKYR